MNSNFRNLAIWVVIGLLLMALFNLFQNPGQGRRGNEISYSEFLAGVDSGNVAEVTIAKHRISGAYRDKGAQFTTIAPEDPNLVERLNKKGVKITARPPEEDVPSILGVLVNWFPMLLLIGVWIFFMRQMQSGGGRAMGFGKSKAKLLTERQGRVTFEDVAGVDEAKQDLQEIVEFLRDPGKFQRLGGRIPSGVLLVGPPGTGKTLLARAVAGEADVPFFALTGSSFVELFVGVGASRVRDLFSNARKAAPSIIFIDEIDAIGGRRGGAVIGGGNDEREQTLNQLLSEMDGFDQAAGVVVIAATNRPESLDPALLRPGRFDRQVVVPLPNQNERAAILAVHSKGKKLAADVDLTVTARGTPGFSGADLANLINEAAINAIRDNRTMITAADLDAARDRILLGTREASNVLLPEEKQSVAVHESGHALVAALSPHADPVSKVTILPAGMALGATHQLPEAERHLYSEAYLTDLLAVRLGGRAAELVVFGHGSTGAANDLAEATQLAIRMVREFGLSPALGPVGYSDQGSQYLGGPIQDGLRRPFSEETQRVVDQEVSRLLREAEERAVAMLNDHREELDWLAARLVEKETVDGSVVLEVLHDKKQLVPRASASGPGQPGS
jgi:cell division protease FtsH